MEQAQQILQELEVAGRIMLVSFFNNNFIYIKTIISKKYVIVCLQASPSNVTNDQRGAAEMVFMNFRKTNMPYSICRYILGKVL